MLAQHHRALVLRTVAYGDADVIVHLLVANKGRVAAFARGARKSTRRFAGALEPFSLIEAVLAERRSAELWGLHDASVLEGHAGLRDDLARLAHAGYAAELLHELTHAGQAAEAHFALLSDFLARVSAGAATSARLRALELGALEAAGLTPELSCCARCGGPVLPGRAAFDPAAGGLCCTRCAAPSALPLATGPRLALEQLQQGGLDAADAPLSADGSGRPADAKAFERAAAQAAGPMAAFLDHHLGKSLRSRSFLADMGAAR